MNAELRRYVFFTLLVTLAVFDASCGPGAPANPMPEAESATDSNVELAGRWYPIGASTADDAVDEDAINALGYLGATVEATPASGITVYAADRAYDGQNLFISGHAPQAFLLDMNGEVLHEWKKEAKEVWPDLPIGDTGGLVIRDALAWVGDQDRAVLDKLPAGLLDRQSRGYTFWRRAYLYPNGDLAVSHTNLGVVKFDQNSEVIWAARFMSHHDIDVAPDGRIYALGKRFKEDPRLRAEGVTVDDTIVVLAPDGTMEREFSIAEAFLKSPYAPTIWIRPGEFDLLHTNTIEVLDGRLANKIPAFKKGNVLISCLQLDTIAVVDMQTEAVVWALGGMFDNMHQPTVLENGNMLVFDNHGNFGKSRVFEFDPLTQHVEWMYAPIPNTLFDSTELGSAQRLPNGNTLITESTRGRAFELTAEKEIVWEHRNPYRGGENDELVAATLEIVRYPEAYTSSWLGGRN